MAEKLTADFTKALPGGVIDDATYEAVESALDKASAPCRAEGRWLTLPERVAALAAACDEAEQDAHELTKALTGLVGGGSEMFVQKRGRFLADIRYCVERLRERSHMAHRVAVDETLRAKRAEARVDELSEALKAVRAAIMEHAPDTLWVDLIETAVDRIDAALAQAPATPAEEA